MRWCWNWQTGMVEGHMPLGRAGSIPAQRTENRLWAVFFISGAGKYFLQESFF